MLDGNDVKDITTESLRRNLSVVMQDVFLFSDSIKENISIGRKDSITDELIESSAQSARAAGFIGKLSDSDGFDDSCAGVGFYHDLDCRAVDFCTDSFVIDKSNASNLAELAEPLVREWAGST